MTEKFKEFKPEIVSETTQESVDSRAVTEVTPPPEILEKIVPYQGWIGIVICAISVFLAIFWLFYTPLYFSRGLGGFVWWISNLGASILSMVSGFLLGFAMIRNSLLKNAPDDVRAKVDELHRKLVKVQTPLGFTCIIVGAWTILYVILYSLIFWR